MAEDLERGVSDSSVGGSVQRPSYCRGQNITVPNTFEELERNVITWMSRCVMSRTEDARGLSANREVELVRQYSNLRELWDNNLSNQIGVNVAINVRYIMNANSILSITFSTATMRVPIPPPNEPPNHPPIMLPEPDQYTRTVILNRRREQILRALVPNQVLPNVSYGEGGREDAMIFATDTRSFYNTFLNLMDGGVRGFEPGISGALNGFQRAQREYTSLMNAPEFERRDFMSIWPRFRGQLEMQFRNIIAQLEPR